MRTPPSFLAEFSNSSEYRSLFSPKNLARLARAVLFIVRCRKLSGSAFFHLCTFFDGPHAYPTLDEMRAELQRAFHFRLSKSSLSARFSPAAAKFMQEAFRQVSGIEFRRRYECGRMSVFEDIVVVDSTVLNLDPKCAGLFRGSGGGASASAAKVQFCFGLLSGSVRELSLHQGVRSDSAHKFSDTVANTLYLADSAYTTVDNIRAIAAGRAWFVFRYRYGTLLFRPDGRPIPMAAIDRLVGLLRPGDVVDMPVLMTKGKVPVRLVLRKVPPGVGNEIRRKLKTDKQKKRRNLSPGRMAFCDVNAHITNLGAEQMPADLLREVYALRWQVEIMFKTWKSGLEIDQVRNIGAHQFQCLLYGKLIRMLICMAVLWKAKLVRWRTKSVELSEIKGMNLMKEQTEGIREWLVTKKQKNGTFLGEMWLLLTQTCVKERKKDDITPFETIQFYA